MDNKQKKIKCFRLAPTNEQKNIIEDRFRAYENVYNNLLNYSKNKGKDIENYSSYKNFKKVINQIRTNDSPEHYKTLDSTSIDYIIQDFKHDLDTIIDHCNRYPPEKKNQKFIEFNNVLNKYNIEYMGEDYFKLSNLGYFKIKNNKVSKEPLDDKIVSIKLTKDINNNYSIKVEVDEENNEKIKKEKELRREIFKNNYLENGIFPNNEYVPYDYEYDRSSKIRFPSLHYDIIRIVNNNEVDLTDTYKPKPEKMYIVEEKKNKKEKRIIEKKEKKFVLKDVVFSKEPYHPKDNRIDISRIYVTKADPTRYLEAIKRVKRAEKERDRKIKAKLKERDELINKIIRDNNRTVKEKEIDDYNEFATQQLLSAPYYNGDIQQQLFIPQTVEENRLYQPHGKKWYYTNKHMNNFNYDNII